MKGVVSCGQTKRIQAHRGSLAVRWEGAQVIFAVEVDGAIRIIHLRTAHIVSWVTACGAVPDGVPRAGVAVDRLTTAGGIARMVYQRGAR